MPLVARAFRACAAYCVTELLRSALLSVGALLAMSDVLRPHLRDLRFVDAGRGLRSILGRVGPCGASRPATCRAARCRTFTMRPAPSAPKAPLTERSPHRRVPVNRSIYGPLGVASRTDSEGPQESWYRHRSDRVIAAALVVRVVLGNAHGKH